MRTLKLFFCTIAFALGTLTFTSCDLGSLLGGDDIVEQGWADNGNTLTYSYGFDLGVVSSKFTYTFEFSDDKCTSATYAITYPTAELARTFWDSMSEEEKAKGSIKGKVVTLDETEIYAGMSKEEVKSFLGNPEE